jgi:hypothetical protein
VCMRLKTLYAGLMMKVERGEEHRCDTQPQVRFEAAIPVPGQDSSLAETVTEAGEAKRGIPSGSDSTPESSKRRIKWLENQ